MAEEEQSLSANLFGQSMAAKGTSGIIMLVLVASLGGAGYLLWERGNTDQLAQAAMLAELKKQGQDHEAAKKLLDALVEVGTTSTRQLKIQNYIILSEPAEKAEIKRKLGRPIELQ